MNALNPDESKSNQYLTFTLRDEDFAIDINKMRKVLDVAAMTRISRMPSHICGVINLHGDEVPVLDLGYRLGMEPVIPIRNTTCVMIVETMIDETPVSMGMVADSVQYILDLQTSGIEEMPRLGTNINSYFLNGMGRQGEKIHAILNIDKVLSHREENFRLCLDLDPALTSGQTIQRLEDASATA
jgi:purine-binding chemotaxis protein CheW